MKNYQVTGLDAVYVKENVRFRLAKRDSAKQE